MEVKEGVSLQHILKKFPCVRSTQVKLDNMHGGQSRPWQGCVVTRIPVPVGSQRYSVSTAKEAAYPRLFCARFAEALVLSAGRQGILVSATSPIQQSTAALQAAVRKQCKVSKYKPLLDDYKFRVTVHVADLRCFILDDKNCLLTAFKHVPVGAKLLRAIPEQGAMTTPSAPGSKFATSSGPSSEPKFATSSVPSSEPDSLDAPTCGSATFGIFRSPRRVPSGCYTFGTPV